MTTKTASRYIVTGTDSLYYNTTWGNTPWAVYSKGRTATKCSTDSAIGRDDPLWRDKVVSGKDASNPFTRKGFKTNRPAAILATSTTPLGGNSGTVLSQGGGTYASTYAQVQEWNTPADAALRDLALLRLKRKLSSHMNQQNLLVPLVELRELRGLIRGMADLSMKLLYQLAGTAKTRGKSTKRTFDELWLTYSFGLAPMVGEFQEALKNVADSMYRADHSVVLTGSAKKDWFEPIPVEIGTCIYGAAAQLSTTVYRQLSYRYKAGCILKLLSSNDYSRSDLFSFRIEALPSVGWELLPYSWMFDYFTNVGAFLNDTFVMPPGSTTYIILNTRHQVSIDVVPTLKVSKGTLAHASLLRPGRAEWDYLNRSVITSLPRVGLHFKSVDQIGMNSINKLLNLASLLKYR